LRLTTFLACAFLIACWAGGSLAQEPTAEPRALDAEKVDEQSGPHDPRQRLEQIGIDESSLAGFVDDQPLDNQQRESMAKLIYQMQRIGAPALTKFARSHREIPTIADDPSRFRGELVSLAGLTRYVVREELDPESTPGIDAGLRRSLAPKQQSMRCRYRGTGR